VRDHHPALNAGPLPLWLAVEVRAMQAALPSDPCSPDPVRILYRDEFFLAAYKPSGLAVHRSALVRQAPVMLQSLRDSLGLFVYPVHRLDRQTSGLILFALTAAAARALCGQFRDQRVAKTYLAVVRGWPATQGIVDHPVPVASGASRLPALTAFRRLATVELPVPCGPHASSRYALLELQPRSGRYHQLRRHLKHLSHPIVGDTAYGDGRHNRLFRDLFGSHRLLLQSVCLEFSHPDSGAPVRLTCEPDAELLRAFPGPDPTLFADLRQHSGDPGSAAAL
jgi:tRNA pseudouridine65 synthase